MLLKNPPLALFLAILAGFAVLVPRTVFAWQAQNAEEVLDDENRSFSAEAGHGSVTFGLNYYQNSISRAPGKLRGSKRSDR